jgi:hypothetical protein
MSIPSTNARFSVAPQYAKYRQGTAPALLATGNAVFSANPTASDTLTVDGVLYTFKASLTTAGDVKIGPNLPATLTNLLYAIKGVTAQAGTAYYAGTHPQTRVDAGVGGSTVFFTSLLPGTGGNSITLAKSSTAITLSGATLTGGAHGGDAVASFGSVVFWGQPTATDTLTIAGTTYTYVASPSLSTDIGIGATLDLTIQNTANKLAANVAISKISYNPGEGIITFLDATAGVAGNSLTTVFTPTGTAAVKVNAATLLGGQDVIPFDTSTLTYIQFPALEVTYDPQQMQDMFPYETGSIVPPGMYKGGVYAQGAATLLPRLSEDLGWLLYAATGNCTTTSSGGVATHVFSFNAQQYETFFLAGRMFVTGRPSQGANPFGVEGYDNLVNRLQFSLRPMTPIQASVELIGRIVQFNQYAAGWVDDAAEDFTTVPIMSLGGGVTVLGVTGDVIPVIEATVDFTNMTSERLESVIGSPYLDDLVILRRTLTMGFTLKWNSPEILSQAFAAAKKGTTWSPNPFISTSAGGKYAFTLNAQAPILIPGTGTYYSLQVRANEIATMVASPLSMRPGEIITQKYTTAALRPSSGNYIDFVLVNGNTAGYVLPVET